MKELREQFEKYLAKELNTEMLTPLQWEGIMRALESFLLEVKLDTPVVDSVKDGEYRFPTKEEYKQLDELIIYIESELIGEHKDISLIDEGIKRYAELFHRIQSTPKQEPKEPTEDTLRKSKEALHKHILENKEDVLLWLSEAREASEQEPKEEARKSLFQVLDEMNLEDTKKGTRMVAVSNTLISADKVKQGAKISMGAEEACLYDLMDNKTIPLLMLIDRDEYNKRSLNK